MPAKPKSPATSSLPPLAQRLLDAQVAYHLEQLRAERADPTTAALVDDLLDAAGRHQIADLVDPDAVRSVVARGLATVPRSAAVSGLLELALDVVHAGPARPFTVGDLADREQVAALVDALLAFGPSVERGLDQLADSPLVGTVASRFMGRIVGEVLQANKAVADKVPGLGTLMSFGTSTAARVVGAADRQFEGLLGDTVGKGGAFAVRRLNRIVVETLQDPTTREALLQAWDVLAEERVTGLRRHTSREALADAAEAAHELVATVLAGAQAADLVDVLVEELFARFGGYTPLELLEELDLDRDQFRDDVVRLGPALLAALDESGDLERLVRSRLEPFYASAEVAALLG